MPQPTAPDLPVEAVAVARMLGCAPEQLTDIKLLPGDSAYPPPDLPGFTCTKGTITFLTHHGHPDTRGMVRYDSPDGPLIVVPHEDGPQFWLIFDHAAQVVSLLGGIAGLITFAKSQRRTSPHPTHKIRKRSYTPAGEIAATQKPWDGKTLAPDNPSTAGEEPA